MQKRKEFKFSGAHRQGAAAVVVSDKDSAKAITFEQPVYGTTVSDPLSFETMRMKDSRKPQLLPFDPR
jgi:hypothetical protein